MVDEDMVEVQGNEIGPKGNKMEEGEGSLSEKLEGVGANLNWPLMLQ